jgi:tetratricopeptide (TPR) repeat protein
MKGFRLYALGEEDALSLLRGDREDLSREHLCTIASRLGRLTLALAVSSRILSEDMTPEEFIDKLEAEGVEVFNDEEQDEYKEANLVKLFNISMELVKRKDTPKSRLAEAMVKVGGWFATAPIPFHLLQNAAARMSPELREGDGAEASRLLVRYSLGDRDAEGAAFFHQLVQDYGRFLGGQEAGKAMILALFERSDAPDAQSAVHYQNAYDVTIPGTRQRRRDMDLGEDGRHGVVQHIGIPLVYHYVGAGFDLARACTVVNTFPKGRSQTLEAKIMKCRGRVLDESGAFVAAYQQYEQALRLQERVCLHKGVQCDQCLTSPIQGLRYKSLDQEDYDLCAGCKEERGLTFEQFVLFEHPSVAATLGNMAGLLMRQGKYEEALPLYERSLRISEKALGPEHPSVAARLCHNMAGLLERQGKYDEALPLYERSLRISEKALGPEHPDVATTLGGMASLLESQGKYDEALPLYERDLRISEKALGPEHPSVATTLGSMAGLLQRQGKYDEALPLYERDLRISEKALGPEHPDVATTLSGMAGLLRSQGRYEEALPLYERSLRISEKALGPEHPDVATTLSGMAGLLESQGRYEEAMLLYERDLRISKMALGPEHPDVATTLGSMARLLGSQGKYKEALSLYERSLRISEKALGPEHQSVAITLDNMAGLLESEGKYDEALPLYERSLRILE